MEASRPSGFVEYKDYTNPSKILCSYENLRDFKFHEIDTSIIPAKKNVWKEQLDRSKVSMNFAEDESIVLGIQNDENFIKFLLNIKSKTSVIVVVFVIDGNIKCLIKSKESHPILFLNFPIDGDKFFSRINNAYYALPVEQINVSTSITKIINGGYFMYYSNDKGDLKLHFQSKEDDIVLPILAERNFTFLNRCLRPVSLDSIEPHSTKDDEENLTRLNNITILIFAQVKNNDTVINDLNAKNESEVKFEITKIDMCLNTINDVGRVSRKHVVGNSESMIWKAPASGVYNLPKRVMLLKSNANSKIHSGNYSYLIFGIYDTRYHVFIRLITNEKITLRGTAESVNLKTFINDKYSIFQMYYCKKTAGENEFPLNRNTPK